MKFVLTGRDPIGQPDLTRKVVVTPEFFSLTMDGFDGATGRMHFNGTVKVKRAFDFYHIVRTYDSNRPGSRYTISGGSQSTKLEILVYDAEPYELLLTLQAANDANHERTAIPGPCFQLDNKSRPVWRALVETMLRNIDLGRLPTLATNLGAVYPDQVSVNWLAHQLTTIGVS